MAWPENLRVVPRSGQQILLHLRPSPTSGEKRRRKQPHHFLLRPRRGRHLHRRLPEVYAAAVRTQPTLNGGQRTLAADTKIEGESEMEALVKKVNAPGEGAPQFYGRVRTLEAGVGRTYVGIWNTKPVENANQPVKEKGKGHGMVSPHAYGALGFSHGLSELEGYSEAQKQCSCRGG